MRNTKITLPFFLCFALLTGIQSQIFAQEKNDPKATAILDKLKKKYDQATSKEIAFSMVTENPGGPKETIQGKLIQQGKAFNLDMGKTKMMADGKTLWVIQDKGKEVQINDQTSSKIKDELSPENILQLYKSKDYIYALVPGTVEDGHQIEFKPTAKNADITKFRLTIDPVKNEISSLKVFQRDGSKFSVNVKSTKLNQKYPASQFAFSAAAYPGYHIEDLRID